MRLKNFIIIFLFFFFFIISGCSKIDCSEKDTTYQKFTLDEQSGECVPHNIQKNVCGNRVAEEGENFCNCPKDVPTNDCQGKIGDYLIKKCNEDTKTCGLYQNEKVILVNKELDFKNSDMTIVGDISLNNPFILNSDDKNKVKIKLTLFKYSTVPTIVIRDIILETFSIENNVNTKFGSYEFNNIIFKKIGDKSPIFEIGLFDTDKYISKENLRFNLVVSYVKDTYNNQGDIILSEPKKEILVSSIGQWNIINPKFPVK